MEVVLSQDFASDNNNNPISGEVLEKECVKQTGTRVNLQDSKRSNYLQITTASRSDHDDEVVAIRARVGAQYQAVLPAFIPQSQRVSEPSEDRSLQCWSPFPHEDEKLERFIRLAMGRYRYSREQGMAMLFWHKHNMYEALHDLPNFAPKPTEWDFEDKLIFEQALQIKGKSFQHIQEMLPGKSIASLVEYYYSRTSTSLRGKNRRRWTLLKKDSAEYDSGSGEGDDGQEALHNGCVVDEEPSASFSDLKIRNDMYEEHCEKNHSDLNRDQRSSCPICLKKVLNRKLEKYHSGMS